MSEIINAKYITRETNHMEYQEGMEIVPGNIIDQVLAARESYDETKYTAADVIRALSKDVLTPEDFAALLSLTEGVKAAVAGVCQGPLVADGQESYGVLLLEGELHAFPAAGHAAAEDVRSLAVPFAQEVEGVPVRSEDRIAVLSFIVAQLAETSVGAK